MQQLLSKFSMNVTSSAYRTAVTSFTSEKLMDPIKAAKRVGPKTEPCGTPEGTTTQGPYTSIVLTRKLLPVRYESNHSKKAEQTPLEAIKIVDKSINLETVEGFREVNEENSHCRSSLCVQ